MEYVETSILWDWTAKGEYADYLLRLGLDGIGCTSLFTLTEMRMAMLRKNHGIREIEELMNRIINDSGLIFINMTEEDFQKSMELSKRYSLTTFDSIHAAICISNGFALSTLDKDYGKIAGLKTVRPER
ncbi:MAG: PIN domain-containing protein [Candidatus Micrarchaeota archaeon]